MIFVIGTYIIENSLLKVEIQSTYNFFVRLPYYTTLFLISGNHESASVLAQSTLSQRGHVSQRARGDP